MKSDESTPRFEMPTLAYHEAVPGHHFQITVAQQALLPSFRVTGFTSYVEGWALYAERLVKELGWYEGDIYADLGRLQAEMLRAVRLVVDTGIHVKGWSLTEAIQYMVDRGGFDEDFAAGQIARYAAWPGQSTAYKIGMNRILEVRDGVEEELGTGFDLKAFHSALLLGGSVPLDMLEETVRQNLDRLRKKSPDRLQPGGSAERRGAKSRFKLPRPERARDQSRTPIWGSTR